MLFIKRLKEKKKEKLTEEVQNLVAGQLCIAQETIKSNKGEKLSEQEIDEIFAKEVARRQKFKLVEEYRNRCPNLRSRCMGLPNITKSGCMNCMDRGIFDIKNGLPAIGTEEYDLLEAKKMKAMKKAVKKCNLETNKNFCEYKGVFNYCAMCNKEFKRSR